MYCTASDVRSIIHKSPSDAEIEMIIELSDAKIDKCLGSQDPLDKVILRLSILITVSALKLR
jgi:hypothetical protein